MAAYIPYFRLVEPSTSTLILFSFRHRFFSYYNGLFLCRSSDDIRRKSTLAISEFSNLAGVQFLLNAAEETAQGNYNRLLRFDHV